MNGSWLTGCHWYWFRSCGFCDFFLCVSHGWTQKLLIKYNFARHKNKTRPCPYIVLEVDIDIRPRVWLKHEEHQMAHSLLVTNMSWWFQRNMHIKLMDKEEWKMIGFWWHRNSFAINSNRSIGHNQTTTKEPIRLYIKQSNSNYW